LWINHPDEEGGGGTNEKYHLFKGLQKRATQRRKVIVKGAPFFLVGGNGNLPRKKKKTVPRAKTKSGQWLPEWEGGEGNNPHPGVTENIRKKG